jgi:shikimate kinase
MGAGKSAVARALAARLGVDADDLDARLERTRGRTIAEWFEAEGEEHFRDAEGAALRAALDEGAAVIACGGGTVIRDENRALLRERCDTVWLDVEPDEAVRRMGSTVAERPLLQGGAPAVRLAALARDRANAYAEVARARIETTGRTIDDVVAEIIEILELR